MPVNKDIKSVDIRYSHDSGSREVYNLSYVTHNKMKYLSMSLLKKEVETWISKRVMTIKKINTSYLLPHINVSTEGGRILVVVTKEIR